jgi:quercetin dioxygenase-like cupin family protein
MKIAHYNDVELNEVNVEGANNAKIRRVLTEKDGAPTFTMRIFELGEEGCTPYHAHESEHEIFVIDGKGAIVDIEGEEIILTPGMALLIPPHEKHQFKNTSSVTFKFICLVPNKFA